MEKNTDVMANMMVNYLSQSIGQEKEGSPQIDQAKSQVLAATQERVNSATSTSIEVPLTKEEC